MARIKNAKRSDHLSSCTGEEGHLQAGYTALFFTVCIPLFYLMATRDFRGFNQKMDILMMRRKKGKTHVGKSSYKGSILFKSTCDITQVVW